MHRSRWKNFRKISEARSGVFCSQDGSHDGPYRAVGDRHHGMYDNDTVYLVKMTRFAPLNWGAFKALGVYNTFGATYEAENILDRMGVSAAQRQAALAVGAR